jgi:tetratricopeptide (TPR) repeat protein
MVLFAEDASKHKNACVRSTNAGILLQPVNRDQERPMAEQDRNTEQSGGSKWPFVMGWVGRITALIGLFTAIGGGITWLVNRHSQQSELKAKMALAEAQAKQGEYQASIQTYADILKTNPLYRPALDAQLDATMEWDENFHVLVPEGQSATSASGPELDQMMEILDAGFTRAKGSRAADVQAHLGWAHWLNQKIAEREFGSTAEDNLRAALAADPSNVYANAMLGNWLLQTNGSLTEAIQHFDTAVATGKARPLVRTFEIGGVIDLDRKGARVELMKVANDMRKANEPLDADDRKRIRDTCFEPIITDHGELEECLTAVPSDEAWSTYLWLDNNAAGGEFQPQVRDFVYANLLELNGKRQESLTKYRALQQELKSEPGSLKDRVDGAVIRLSRSTSG